MGSMETRIREWAGSTFTPARSVTDAGYLIDPVFYSVIEFSRRLESGSAEVCSTACRSACITECGPALSTGGEPTGEQRRCLDASPVPSFVHTNTNACRSIIGVVLWLLHCFLRLQAQLLVVQWLILLPTHL
jgi:hypothetical protein